MTRQRNQNESPLIVGVDIGGTKTHLRAERLGGATAEAVGERILPSRQWRTRNWDDDARLLLDLVADVANGSPVDAIGVGAHGCDDEEECRVFARAFAVQTEILVSVVNDAELMPLALGLQGQIGLVAGTGSIAVCRPAGAGMISAGGWGWIVGDEGSAAGLVREAVRAVVRHLDAGGAVDEPLVQAMLRSLSVPALPRLASALAALGSPAAVGAHAAAVFGAADGGSELARRVIRKGGQELAQLVLHLQARGAAARHVVAGGGVIVAQPTLWQAFSAAVECGSQGTVTPHLFTGSPVEGACRLAATLARSSSGKHGRGFVAEHS